MPTPAQPLLSSDDAPRNYLNYYMASAAPLLSLDALGVLPLHRQVPRQPAAL